MIQLKPVGSLKGVDASEKELASDLAQFFNDPLGFVYYAFPWGHGELSAYEGPDEWQTEFLSKLKDSLEDLDLDAAIRTAAAAGHGVGKALPHSTIVETPSGPLKWADVGVGTELFGSDGLPTKVIAKSPEWYRPVYKVTFDDKTFAMCDANHLWTVKGRQERRLGMNWIALSTQQLMDRGIKRSNGQVDARNWQIPTIDAVHYTEQEYTLHPYTMGVYLGDGCHSDSRIPTSDWDLISALEFVGEKVSLVEDRDSHVIISIGMLNSRIKNTELNGLLSHNKYIPSNYLRGSVDQRWELLRGLMDTDGTCSKDGKLQFTSTSEKLANDIAWLVRSLGGKARVGSPKRRGYKSKTGEYISCRDSYDVQIVLPDGSEVFKIQRKQERVKENYEDRYIHRWIDSIEYSHDEIVHCVQVDAIDSLFSVNDFILTHNSALVCWLIIWFMSTRPNGRAVVTANTAGQLSGKTWPELSKWHRMSINRHWFCWTATKFYHVLFPEIWWAQAVPWSKDNSEAFAGLHAEHVMVVFDEASAIADVIWEVTEGAMTTPGAMWFCFGNPTRVTGRFYECFHKSSHRWQTYQVDARKARMTNQSQIEQWIEDYGDDSDFARVRIKGEFPRTASNQFIGADVVLEAMQRRCDPNIWKGQRPIIGVDVARFGSDMSIILIRQGAMMHPAQKFLGLDTAELSGKIVEEYRKYGNNAVVCIDGVGIGAGVVDRLNQLGLNTIDVQSAAKPLDGRTYSNKRAELWGKMKDWLMASGCLPKDKDLEDQIPALEYGLNNKLQIQLQSKEDIRKSGGKSPDVADALAYTFAYEEAVMFAKMAKARPVRRVQW